MAVLFGLILLLLASSIGIFYVLHVVTSSAKVSNTTSFSPTQYPSTPEQTIQAVCNAFKRHDFQTVFNLSSSQSELRHRSERDYAAIQWQIRAQRGDLVSCLITNVVKDVSGSLVSALVTSTWSKSNNYMQTRAFHNSESLSASDEREHAWVNG
jgi:hypothetical protein